MWTKWSLLTCPATSGKVGTTSFQKIIAINLFGALAKSWFFEAGHLTISTAYQMLALGIPLSLSFLSCKMGMIMAPPLGVAVRFWALCIFLSLSFSALFLWLCLYLFLSLSFPVLCFATCVSLSLAVSLVVFIFNRFFGTTFINFIYLFLLHWSLLLCTGVLWWPCAVSLWQLLLLKNMDSMACGLSSCGTQV